MNVVVGDEIVVRLADPEGDATRELIPAVGDRAIGDLIEGGLVIRAAANRHFAYLDAARTEIGECATGNPIFLAAAGQFESIGPDVQDLTMVERAEANTRPRHGGRHSDRRLVKTASRWVRPEAPLPIGDISGPLLTDGLVVEKPSRVGEADPAKRHVLDKFPRHRVAGQLHHLCEVRRDDLCIVGFDTCRRDQQNGPVSRIDVELSRLCQALADVFNPIAVPWIELKHTLFAEVDRVTLLVD